MTMLSMNSLAHLGNDSLIIIKIKTTFTTTTLLYYLTCYSCDNSSVKLPITKQHNWKNKIKFNKSLPIAQRCTSKQAVKRQQHILEQVSIKQKQKQQIK